MRLNNIVIRFIAYGKEFFKRIPLFGALSSSQLSLSIFLKIQTFANHAKSQRAIIIPTYPWLDISARSV